MEYNVSYDIISLIVLFIVTYKFYSQRQFPVFSNRLYGCLLLLGIFNLIFDLIGCYAVSINSNFPLVLSYIVNALYYVTEISIPAAFAVYELTLISNKERIGYLSYILLLSPLCVFLLILIIGLPQGLIFVISENNEFTYGPISRITFFSLGFYIVLMIVILVINRKKYSQKEILSFEVLFLLIGITTTIQFLYPSELLSGTAIALTFLIMYFTIQDPKNYLDYATGLFNDIALNKVVESHYLSKKHLYMAVIEFHDLHTVYALYGRKVGDSSLAYIGKYLSDFKTCWAFRGTDSRFICNFSHQKDLNAFVEDFNKIRNKPVIIGDKELTIKFSLVCILHCENYSLSELSSVVDTTFDSHNVEQYKDKTTYFSNFEMKEYLRLVDISNEIHGDLSTGENIVIYYQPIFSLKDNNYNSAEALVRYNSSKYGLIQPFEFIPALSANDMIYDLDEIVCKKVVEDLVNNKINTNVFKRIHINLSAGHFTSLATINRIFDIVDLYKVSHDKLAFEITENIASIEADALVECANQIINKGFGLALDDFGTGYSNVSRITSLPFTHVKLDRSITIGSDITLESTIQFLKSLNSTIVVEGVEDIEKVNQLKELEVDLIQGNYYSKPVPVEKLNKLIDKE